MLSLKEFLDASVVNFWAIDTICHQLYYEGFQFLDARKQWDLVPGGKYYTLQNGTAVIAFIVPDSGEKKLHAPDRFHIISAHSDSPGFRVKPKCEMLGEGRMLRLNTEVYGGPILYTWFDRPLSLAGRVILRGDDAMHPVTRLVRFDRPMLTIPHLAIHFNRAVNEGNPLSRQRDMLPVVGTLPEDEKPEGWLCRQIAAELEVKAEDILDYDISLYDTTKACTVGAYEDYITSGRIDDLSMVHAATAAIADTQPSSDGTLKVMAIFDNEETGSGTKQGAGSPILDYVLRRVYATAEAPEEKYLRSVSDSFMVSADNAHGAHPNYMDKYDPTNHPLLGGGPVIKINANCKYMTDADSAAVFASICKDAEVPVQYFVNHSDVAGGSTLGNILTSQIPLRGVDMGAAVWAMHSARETASLRDHEMIIRAFKAFYAQK